MEADQEEVARILKAPKRVHQPRVGQKVNVSAVLMD
jgi:hypothetical protein